MKHNAVIFLSVLSSSFAVASSPKSDLKIEAGAVRQSLSLQDLKKRLTLHSASVEDPVYHSRKIYEGFLMTDLFKFAGIDLSQGDEIAFHCIDGYTPTMPIQFLSEGKGLLAIREKSTSGDWQKFQQGKAWMTPAPFYVVWENPLPEKPWPYQVVGIEIINFKKKYARLYPADLEKTSAAYKGFQTYKNECMRCHSINLQGGELCPELNIPKNITEYRDVAFLTKFIKNPGEFRERSKMPAFPQLSDGQITEILEYFRYMKSHKQTAR